MRPEPVRHARAEVRGRIFVPDDSQSPAADAPPVADQPPTPEPAAPAGREVSFGDALRAADADVQDGGESRLGSGDDRGPDESAPGAGGVGSGTARTGGGRRSRAAEEAASRIADLERQVADRDPERLRQRWQSEQHERAAADEDALEAERYERLRDVPIGALSNEDYQWREDYQARLSAFPKARSAMLAEAGHRIKRAEAALAERENGFLLTIRSQVAALNGRPGVSADTLKSAPDFGAIGAHLYAAGDGAARAELQPKLDAALEEVRRLKGGAAQSRLSGPGGIASARAPIAGGGRSAGPSGAIPEDASTTDLFAAAIRRSRDGPDT